MNPKLTTFFLDFLSSSDLSEDPNIMFYTMRAEDQQHYYLSCRICEHDMEGNTMMTRKNINNHIKKHFLARPELKERYFLGSDNEDPVV